MTDSMRMAVMGIRIVGMDMRVRRVHVPVRMARSWRNRNIMFVIVVLVAVGGMRMLVDVGRRLVRVYVFMPLGQVQPDPQRHQ